MKLSDFAEEVRQKLDFLDIKNEDELYEEGHPPEFQEEIDKILPVVKLRDLY
jgi:hypothetical protein